tara:strand:- start:82 stop:1251 length:1170 start_codon:yes stop_codon:yes gene_type:complete
MNKITIIGSGYVGMSLAVLFSQSHETIIYDIDPKKVELINNNQSTITDPLIDEYLSKKSLHLHATSDQKVAYGSSQYYVVSTPTNFNDDNNSFDTSIVESVIQEILLEDSNANIIIKSTIPIGFTEKMRKKFNSKTIFFSPEFLREEFALHDNLFPSRIIIGPYSEKSKEFASILQESSSNKNSQIIFMSSDEAESVKLFSNSYLAMRVAFFNELDSFAITKKLNTLNLIQGVCADPRIGNHYNNPSFGYGGYCLPKDSKQLLSSYDGTPQALISATVNSNEIRKTLLADLIKQNNIKTIGFYRLIAKTNSTNFKSSAITSLIEKLRDSFKNILIYEPLLDGKEFEGIMPIKTLSEFIEKSELIISNRMTDEIEGAASKVFSRDIFRNL